MKILKQQSKLPNLRGHQSYRLDSSAYKAPSLRAEDTPSFYPCTKPAQHTHTFRRLAGGQIARVDVCD
jgi:hypothetical protein